LVLALPLRALVHRFAFALLLVTAVTLMILSQAEPRLIEMMRTGVTDAATPVLKFFSHPAATVAGGVDDFKAMMTVHERNERLHLENQRLKRWQAVAERLSHENNALRRQLRVIPDPRATFVSARVIADSGGPFVRTILIAAGSDVGARKSLAVVNHDGLVGRVVEAGQLSARVLLITDLNSRIPVVLESTRDRAILSGNNTPSPELAFLAVDAVPKPGDRIVTSGEGGLFPPGLPVGLVSSVTDEGALVQPFVVWDRLDFVTVLDYTVPGILPETQRAGREGSLR